MKRKNNFAKKLTAMLFFAAAALPAPGEVGKLENIICSTIKNGGMTFRQTVMVPYAQQITPQNGLKNPIWAKVPVYSFRRYIHQVEDINGAATEEAAVQYLYNDKYFFVRVSCDDSDVMSTSTKNQEYLFLQGDVIEVFIKPEKGNYYWEIYGTPNKLFSKFYFPSRGRLIASVFGPTDVKIPVDAAVNGTFNNCSDRDRSWEVLISIPRSELERNGLKFAPGCEWTVFTSRYNYSRYLPDFELSSFPQANNGYHNHECYAKIKFCEL